jgi:hypothetical protein
MAAVVIAGLDPAIHPVRKKLLTKGMDHPKSGLPDFGRFKCASRVNPTCVVKPAGDGTERRVDRTDAIRPFALFDLEMTDLMQFYDCGPCAGR